MGFSGGLPRVGGVNAVKWASVVVGVGLVVSTPRNRLQCWFAEGWWCQPREMGFSAGLPRVGGVNP